MSKNRVIPFLAAAAALVTAQLGHSVTLADLTDGYDVFVHGDAELKGVHVHGSTAVGGILTLDGSQSTFGNVTVDSDYVVATNTLNLASTGGGGQMSSNLSPQALRVGTQNTGQTIDSNGFKDSVTNKSLNFQSPQTGSFGPLGIDFDSKFDLLKGVSDALKSLTPTLDFNTLIPDLNNWNYSIGNSGVVNVLNLTVSQFASIRGMNFSALIGATDKLIVNVDLTGYAGEDITQNRNGEEAGNHIIWNFFGGPALNFRGQFIGAILAPEVFVSHNSSDQIKGMVIADQFFKDGSQIHYHKVDYDLPEPDPVPESGTTALLALLAGLPLFILARRRRG